MLGTTKTGRNMLLRWKLSLLVVTTYDQVRERVLMTLQELFVSQELFGPTSS